MEMSGTDINVLLKDYPNRVIFDNKHDKIIKKINFDQYENILVGVIDHQGKIDQKIEGLLEKSWTISRIDMTLRAILRASIYELLFMPEIPFKVVINEYLDIARSFFDDKEPEFLNAVLDNVVKSLHKRD
tara:strand:+ start:22311 stop:22700 length:390 start_codon:yes stop_codon:yes gene_type:complete